jgi:redox-sensitive bicupin YhaK (pirin superfamily)
MNTSISTLTLTNERGVERLIVGQATHDGAGVKLTRVLTKRPAAPARPVPNARRLWHRQPGDYIGGFPDHPHRGSRP